MFDDTPYRVQFLNGGSAVLLGALTWRTRNTFVRVPAGFVTDGASIPPLCWWLVGHPFSYSLLKAATLHDYELQLASAPPAVIHRRLYHALRSCGNGRVRAGVCFAGAWIGEGWRRVRRACRAVWDVPIA